jgi:hypothetical protein
MTTIKILKNGNCVKQFTATTEKMFQKYYALAVDIAGGMWNGKDEFKVVSEEWKSSAQ